MDSRERRYGIYVAIIVVTLVMTAARIASVSARDGKTPFLSANDRSRWTAVIALVDHHTPTIDHFQSMRHWQTIDKVRHIGPDGELHYYSSKPPLLAYLMACKYWCFQRVTGLQFERNPFIVGRSMLALVNLPLLAIYGVCIVFLVERWGRSDWGRIFCVAAAMWGTFLTPFAVTLNNHLPAAVAVVGTLDSLDRLWQHTRYPRLFAWLAGLGATLTASFELPALSFLAAVTAWMVWQRERFHVGVLPRRRRTRGSRILCHELCFASEPPSTIRPSQSTERRLVMTIPVPIGVMGIARGRMLARRRYQSTPSICLSDIMASSVSRLYGSFAPGAPIWYCVTADSMCTHSRLRRRSQSPLCASPSIWCVPKETGTMVA